MRTFDGINDAEMLARIMDAEAGQEGPLGKLAVGAVIRNRAQVGGYGDGIRGVITKPGQFSAINDVTGYARGKGANKIFWRKPSEESVRIAQAVLAGQYEDPTGGATHYFNPKAANPKWARGKEFRPIGNHVFGNADAGRIAGGGGAGSLAGGEGNDRLQAIEAELARRKGQAPEGNDRLQAIEAELARRQQQAPEMLPDPRDRQDVEAALGQLAQEEPPAESKGAWDTFMDGVRSIREVTGPMGDRIVDTATLGLIGDEFEAFLNATFKGEDGKTWKEEYDEYLAARRARDDSFEESSPNLAIAADVAGGAALGGAVKGPVIAAEGLGAKMGVGALEGASVGSALGFAQGQGGIENRTSGALEGAVGGGLIGGAIPGVAVAAGAGARTVGGVLGIGSPDKQAARLVTDALPDKLDPRITGKPDTLLDIGGENVRRLADTARAVPSKGGEYMSDFLEDRVATQGNRIAGDASDYLGKTGTKYYSTVQDVIATRKKQAGPIYERLNKQTVQMTGGIARNILERPAMQDALRKAARTYENKTGIQIDLGADRLPFAVLDQAKKEMDKAIRWGKTPDGAAAGADVGALKSLQKQFLRLMDGQLPGYQRARSIYSGSAAIEDAMDSGRKFLKGDADEMFESFRNLPKAEQDAFRLGVARQLQDLVEKTPDGADAARKLINSEFVRDRLQMVTRGHGEFKKFLGNLQRESTYAKVRNDVLKGSQTQHRQTAADMALAGVEAVGTGTVTGVLSAIKRALVARAKGINKPTADRISRLLANEDIDGVMRFLQSNAGRKFVKKVGGHIDDDAQYTLLRASAGLLGQDAGEAVMEAIPR